MKLEILNDAENERQQCFYFPTSISCVIAACNANLGAKWERRMLPQYGTAAHVALANWEFGVGRGLRLHWCLGIVALNAHWIDGARFVLFLFLGHRQLKVSALQIILFGVSGAKWTGCIAICDGPPRSNEQSLTIRNRENPIVVLCA